MSLALWKKKVVGRKSILPQFHFSSLASKFRFSREIGQEWSLTRVAEHEWPLVARRGMPRHEWPGRQDALNCRHPVLCVSDRDPRWNLDPGPARNPSRVTSSRLITLRMLPLFQKVRIISKQFNQYTLPSPVPVYFESAVFQ